MTDEAGRAERVAAPGQHRHARDVEADRAVDVLRAEDVRRDDVLDDADTRRGGDQGRKRVIQRLFDVGVLEAMSEKKAFTL